MFTNPYGSRRRAMYILIFYFRCAPPCSHTIHSTRTSFQVIFKQNPITALLHFDTDMSAPTSPPPYESCSDRSICPYQDSSGGMEPPPPFIPSSVAGSAVEKRSEHPAAPTAPQPVLIPTNLLPRPATAFPVSSRRDEVPLGYTFYTDFMHDHDSSSAPNRGNKTTALTVTLFLLLVGVILLVLATNPGTKSIIL